MLLLVQMRRIASAYRVAVKLMEAEKSGIDDLQGDQAALVEAKDILRSAGICSFGSVCRCEEAIAKKNAGCNQE